MKGFFKVGRYKSLIAFSIYVLLLTGCGSDSGTGPTGGIGSVTVSIDGGSARSYTLGAAAYLPAGSDGLTSPAVDPNATRITAVASDASDFLLIDVIGNSAAAYDAASGNVQMIYNIDGGVASGGRGFLIQGPGMGTGSVTINTYGAVGESMTGIFSVTANEYDGSMNLLGQVTLTGSFDVIRGDNE